MCTLAWGETNAGLWVCFNRDEQCARPPAEPPQLHPGRPHPLIYARDPQGGGTWLALSTAGYVVALLNHYPASAIALVKGTRSRGRLVVKVAMAGSAGEAVDVLRNTDLSEYAPFYMFVLSPEAVNAFAWDGDEVSFPVPQNNFWTTSSYAAGEVIAWRKAWWARQLADHGSGPAALAECLRQPLSDKPAFGATMDRKDARTLNQIDLRIGPQNCSFTYRMREPDGPGYGPPMIINFPQSERSTDA